MPTKHSSPDLREDPYLGTRVHVVGTRQRRPNLPMTGCPFCPGGLEAPESYEVRWFTNRWPAMEGERCEVVLYTPDHDATFASLGADGARRVIDLWTQRTEELGARDDVEFVLIFENRGAEVGATIAHPHGQIYAFDHVPERSQARLDAAWRPDPVPGERLVLEREGWQVAVPFSSPFPFALSIAPLQRRPDLGALSAEERQALAGVLVDVFARLDRLFGEPLPYMMWLNQRPTTPTGWDDAWFNIEIVSPWRAAGVQRFIAAAEVATGEFFNPVIPEELADRLRSA
jgi:UDPglucose--hexose-1-phosphate uridylyltransferase